MTNQLKPLTEPYPEDVAETLSKYPQQNGYTLSLFRTFANSQRFLKKGVPNLLDRNSPISLRMREITILRVTANLNCEYEWGVHVSIFAKAAKLTDSQVAATRSIETDLQIWSEKELNLITVIDQLCKSGVVEDAIVEQFENNWDKEQQLEIMALIGAYHTVSFVANIAKLPNESFGAEFPS